MAEDAKHTLNERGGYPIAFNHLDSEVTHHRLSDSELRGSIHSVFHV
jgi:hypothetical protein